MSDLFEAELNLKQAVKISIEKCLFKEKQLRFVVDPCILEQEIENNLARLRRTTHISFESTFRKLAKKIGVRFPIVWNCSGRLEPRRK